MLVKATNKVGTEVYFLGNFGRQSLQRDKLQNVDSRPDKYQETINIRSDNGHRVRNKRQATARTSFNNKQQESSKTTKKSSVSPLATKKARTGPKPSLSSSNEELPKRLTEQSSKTINGKSTRDDESEKPKESSPSDDESNNSSDEESKQSLTKSATKTPSLCDIMYGNLPDSRSV
jgi:hypothetical protein